MTAIEEFPGELSIVACRGGWKLLIHGPHLSGEVTTGRREFLELIADAYAEVRRDGRPQQGALAHWFPGAPGGGS